MRRSVLLVGMLAIVAGVATMTAIPPTKFGAPPDPQQDAALQIARSVKKGGALYGGGWPVAEAYFVGFPHRTRQPFEQGYAVTREMP
jgi:hypothetical protein